MRSRRYSAMQWRDILERLHITYDETVHGPESGLDPLPEQVESVRMQLLDLDRIIPHIRGSKIGATPRKWEGELSKELDKPENAQVIYRVIEDAHNVVLWGDSPPETHRKNLKTGLKIYCEALRTSETFEPSFTTFLSKTLFREWTDMASSSDARGPDKHISCFEDLKYNKGLVRGNPQEYRKEQEEEEQDPTKQDQNRAPKPDYTFAFPIYVGDRKVDFWRDEGIFSFFTLAELERDKIWSCPRLLLNSLIKKDGTRRKSRTSKVEAGDTNPQTDAKLDCFPWAIVEVKKPGTKGKDIIECFCQALNSCSVALKMLESLYNSDIDSIPPVVALTIIGSCAKVWLAYTKPATDSTNLYDSQQRMVCIWEGSLFNPLDAVELVRLRDNILYWALNNFKSRIRGTLQDRYRKLKSASARKQENESAANEIDPAPLQETSPDRDVLNDGVTTAQGGTAPEEEKYPQGADFQISSSPSLPCEVALTSDIAPAEDLNSSSEGDLIEAMSKISVGRSETDKKDGYLLREPAEASTEPKAASVFDDNSCNTNLDNKSENTQDSHTSPRQDKEPSPRQDKEHSPRLDNESSTRLKRGSRPFTFGRQTSKEVHVFDIQFKTPKSQRPDQPPSLFPSMSMPDIEINDHDRQIREPLEHNSESDQVHRDNGDKDKHDSRMRFDFVFGEKIPRKEPYLLGKDMFTVRHEFGNRSRTPTPQHSANFLVPPTLAANSRSKSASRAAEGESAPREFFHRPEGLFGGQRKPVSHRPWEHITVPRFLSDQHTPTKSRQDSSSRPEKR